MDARVTAMVVTDDDGLLEETARLLTRGGFSTTAVRSGEEALALARRHRPAIIVLDAVLPDMTGIEICFEMRRQLGDQVPIICLSEEGAGSKDRVASLLIGADDVVMKPFDPGEFLARIRRIASRAPAVTSIADVPLTSREVEVLQLLAGGLTQDRIAKELFISPKTVGTHVQRILSKLGVHSRTEAVSLAYRYGLVELEHRLPGA